MSRDAQAVTPEGLRWFELANRAGGKQTPGILGVSTSYIKSKNFLKGDGGIGNVVWMDHKLKTVLAKALPAGAKVATENDVSSLQELAEFLGRS